MRVRIPKGEWDKPGTWTGIVPEGNPYGRGRSANMTCPNGHSFSLIDHTISSNGTVSPSVVCPYDCDFHKFIILEGWTP